MNDVEWLVLVGLLSKVAPPVAGPKQLKKPPGHLAELLPR
jgi:hypothetical protein